MKCPLADFFQNLITFLFPSNLHSCFTLYPFVSFFLTHSRTNQRRRHGKATRPPPAQLQAAAAPTPTLAHRRDRHYSSPPPCTLSFLQALGSRRRSQLIGPESLLLRCRSFAIAARVAPPLAPASRRPKPPIAPPPIPTQEGAGAEQGSPPADAEAGFAASRCRSTADPHRWPADPLQKVLRCSSRSPAPPYFYFFGCESTHGDEGGDGDGEAFPSPSRL